MDGAVCSSDPDCNLPSGLICTCYPDASLIWNIGTLNAGESRLLLFSHVIRVPLGASSDGTILHNYMTLTWNGASGSKLIDAAVRVGEPTVDLCPADPNKTAPGLCGCGVTDTDSDGDGIPDCHDGCPNDPNKTAPGNCGCGIPETSGCGNTGGGTNGGGTTGGTTGGGGGVCGAGLGPPIALCFPALWMLRLIQGRRRPR